MPSYEVQTEGGTYQVDTEEPTGLEKAASNIIPDLKETAKGLGDLVQGPALDIAGGDIASALPKLAKEGEQFWAHPEENIETMAKPLTEPVQYAEEHPVKQAANVAALFGLGKGAMDMDIAPEASAAEMPKGMPATEPSMGSTEGQSPPRPETMNAKGPEVKPPASPLNAVRDYVNTKYGKAAAAPGWPEKVSTYLGEEANKLGAKDLGLQPMQMKSMGTGYKGLEKANALVDYAREKGYLKPTLTDTGRRAQILADQEKAGKYVGALRKIADERAAPDIQGIQKAVHDALLQNYGAGVEKSSAEIDRVMEEFDRHPATHEGLADMATALNKSITNMQKLGQHPGPATDAANLIGRMNNDSIRSILNPEEAKLYTKSLRDYGATKKLEQVTAGAGRRGMANRANQRGILGRLYQDALDRGGYRIGGNIASGMSKAIRAKPSIASSLPQFFEELAHQSESTIDDLVSDIGMSEGGVVTREMADFVSAR